MAIAPDDSGAALGGGATAAGGARAEDRPPPRWSVAAAAAAVAVISSFLFGYQTVVLDTCADLMAVELRWCGNSWQSDCHTSTAYQGLVNASVYLGAAFGALLAGRPRIYLLGSRLQMCVSDAFFVVGGLSCATAQGVVALVVGRLCAGIGLGLCAIAAPVYITEVSPRESRGINAGMHGVFLTIGILAGTSFGLPQGSPPSSSLDEVSPMDRWYWRGLLGFIVLPAILQALLFLRVLPIDPPSFLVRCGRTEEARKLLYRTYGVDTPGAGLQAGLLTNTVGRLELQISELVDAAAAAKETPHIHVRDAMCDPFLRCAIFLGLGLAAFQQLCGINALMSYSNSLFRQGGVPSDSVTLFSTLMSIANVFSSLCSSRVVDHWGRRHLLLAGSGGQAVSMAILMVVLTDTVKRTLPPIACGLIVVTSFTLFVTTFSAGLGAITSLYLSEIYPMEIRGPAMSACGILNWLCSFGVVFFAKFLSLRGCIQLFFLVSFVGMVGVYLWVIETKGCDIEDSPLTPRSQRSSSTLLSPGSPKVACRQVDDLDDLDDLDDDER